MSASSKSKAKGKVTIPEPPSRSGPSMRWVWAGPVVVAAWCVAVVVTAPAKWVAVGHLLAAWRGLAVTVAVVSALAAAAVVWARSRAARADRLAEVIARATHTDPTLIRVGVRGKHAGWARYAPSFDDAPGSRGRDAAEDAITRKVGAPLTFHWDTGRDRVEWSPGQPTGPADADDGDVLEDAPPAPTDRAVDSLTESLQAQARGDLAVTVTSRDETGRPDRIRVTYPPTVRDDSDDTRAAWQDIVGAKLPDRWRPTWDTHGNTLTLERRPPMPAKVTRPTTPGKEGEFRVGVDEYGDAVVWDVKKHPHALVAGATGGGKTILIAGLVVDALGWGWDVVLIDGKGTALAGYRQWPGVVGHGMGEAEPMHEELVSVDATIRHRYAQHRDQGVPTSRFRPTLVVVDEFTEVVKLINRWWATEGAEANGTEVETPKGTRWVKSPLRVAPSIDAWETIARLGREGRVHVVVGIQQAAAKIFGSTESRDQLGFRIGMGATTAESARMLFGDSGVGRDVPEGAQGRGTVMASGGAAREVQVFWTPSPLPHGDLPEDEADAELVVAYRDLARASHRAAPVTPVPSRVPAAVQDPLPEPDEQPEPVPLVMVHPPAEGAWAPRQALQVGDGDTIRFDGVVRVVADTEYDGDVVTLTVLDPADATESVLVMDDDATVEVALT